MCFWGWLFLIIPASVNSGQYLLHGIYKSDASVVNCIMNLPFYEFKYCASHPQIHYPFFLVKDLFVAGIDTTSTTLEWAMAELLLNREKLANAQNELRKVTGQDVIVEESNISNLPYLQAIVKETFRLHPPGPLLIPRKANSDVEICGFRVPESTQILVNVWAIGRDPDVWENPNSFMPERFLEAVIDVKGRNFELLPFGGGRRICPGLPLAMRMLHLTLASLVNSFNWKLQDGLKPEKLDMSEKFGLTLQKAVPLLALPIQV